MEEAPIAKAIIDDLKSDESTAAEYAKMAVNAIVGYAACDAVYDATAVIAKNNRIYNRYTDESKDIDVWIKATAKTYNEFYIIGAYLSDVWSLTGDAAQDAEIVSNMYVRKFTESK